MSKIVRIPTLLPNCDPFEGRLNFFNRKIYFSRRGRFQFNHKISMIAL